MKVILNLKKDWYPHKLVNKYSALPSPHTVTISDTSPPDMTAWEKIPVDKAFLYWDTHDLYHNRNHGLIYISTDRKIKNTVTRSEPQRVCDTCKYAVNNTCRLNPPTPMGFVPINPGWWCGQHMLTTSSLYVVSTHSNA